MDEPLIDLEQIVEEKKNVVITKDNSPECEEAKERIRQSGVQYYEININRYKANNQIIIMGTIKERYCSIELPAIFLKKIYLGGIKKLRKSNIKELMK